MNDADRRAYAAQASLYAQGIAATLRDSDLDAHTRRRWVERSRGMGASVRAAIDGAYPFAPEPDRFGSEPPVGAVLRWEGPSGATVVATRHDVGGSDGWELTGDDVSYSWSEIRDRVGDRRCDVALTWREIPAPEPTPRGDDAVRDWAAGFLTPQTESAHPEDRDGELIEPVGDLELDGDGTVQYHADGRHRHLDEDGQPILRGTSHQHYVRNADGSRSVRWHDHEDGTATYGWSIPGSE